MATLNRTFSVKNGIDVANTIIVDSNRNISNVANLTANTGQFDGNVNVAGTLVTQNIIPVANVTYNLGSPTARFKDLYLSGSTLDLNGVTLSANGDELRANTFNAAVSFVSAGLNVLDQANTARTQANTAYAQANAGFAQANASYAQANAAYGEANNVSGVANASYAQANAAYGQANAARTAANSAANTVRVSANGGSTLSGKQLNFVNTSTAVITVGDAADGNANITIEVIGGGAIGQAYDQANAARDQANTARGTANDAYGQANAAYSQANTARGTANDAYAQANAGYNQANAAYGQANAAYGQANAAYGEANLKLNLTGGTITGDLDVTGNLYVGGYTTYINVSTYTVEDPLIYLAANNELDDMVDIGFMGGKNAAGIYSHTGLIRHAADDKWYLFDGLSEEGHQNNIVDVANTTLATLRANLEANSILLVGNTVATQANLTIANDQANAAYGQANAAYGQANDAYAQANAGYAQANAGYAQANAAYGQANSGFGQANAAYGQANAAYDRANTKVSKSGDTMTGGLTITTAGIGLSVANANVTYSLQVGTLNVTTNTVTTAASGQVVLDKFPATQLASAKYFVQANSSTDYHTTEIVLVQDATNVWLTEYASIQTGPSLGTFTADISGGDVRLLFTAVNSINTIRSVRYGIIP